MCRRLTESQSCVFAQYPFICSRYWQEGEPSNTDEEVCVAVEAKENFFQAWNDYRCDSTKHKWICEKAATEQG